MDQDLSRESRSGAKAALMVERPQTLLREQVVAKLREAITTGLYQPGERLLERELCEALGVSRTSVRESLRQLEIEQLVSVSPTGRPAVATVSPSQAQEIYEFRIVLEKAAVAMFIDRAPDEAFAALTEIPDRFDAALRSRDLESRLRIKADFYDVLFTHAGNPSMKTVFIQLFNRIGFLRSRSLRRQDNARIRSGELRAIVENILARDTGTAKEMLERHVRSVGEIAVRHLLEQEKGTTGE